MPARIARIYRNVETLKDGSPNPGYLPDEPLFWMEYLQCDDGKLRLFTQKIGLAFIYHSHGAADEAAAQIRSEAPELGFVFAQSCSDASVRAAVEELHAPVPLPSARHYHRRQTDQRRKTIAEEIAEEMRADDEHELERIAIDE